MNYRIGHQCDSVVRVVFCLLLIIFSSTDVVGQALHQQARDDVNTSDAVKRRLSFRFSGASWREVTDWISAEGGLAVVAPSLPKTTVNFQDLTRTYSVDQAIDVLGDLLLEANHGVVRSGNKLTIVNLGEKSRNSRLLQIAPVVSPAELADLPQSSIVRCRFRLITRSNANNDYGEPPQGAATDKVLKSLVSPAGVLVALPGSGHASVIDTVRQLQLIHEVLSNEDEPAATTIPLAYQPSDRILERLTPLIRSIERENFESGNGGGNSVNVTEGLDHRSLIVSGNHPARRSIEAIIKQYDVPGESEEFESISLVGLDLQAVQNQIEKLLPARKRAGEVPLYDENGELILESGDQIRWVIDLGSAELRVKGSSWQRDQIRALVDELRKTSRTAVSDRVRILLAGGREIQDAIWRAAQLWKLAGHKSTPIMLSSETTILSGDEFWESNAIRVSLSDDQTVFSSFDSIALDEFVRVVEQLVAAGRERYHVQSEIAIKYAAPSVVAAKVSDAMKRFTSVSIDPNSRSTLALPPAASSRPTFPSTQAGSQSAAGNSPTVQPTPNQDAGQSVPGASRSQHASHQQDSEMQTRHKPIFSAASSSRLARTPTAFVITPVDHQKKLLISGSSPDLAMARQLISIFDSPHLAYERVPKVIEMRYQRAYSIAGHFKEIFGQRYADSLWMSGEIQPAGEPPLVHVKVDASTNSLLVNAEQSDLETLQRLVEALDVPDDIDDEKITAVIPIKGVLNSAELSNALVSLYGDEKSNAIRVRKYGKSTDTEDEDDSSGEDEVDVVDDSDIQQEN